MPLTDTAIRNARTAEKAYKLPDGGGLVLLVNPNGSKWWRWRYRFRGVEKMLSFGVYPEATLKLARERRDEARHLLARGIDPGAKRRVERASQANTFEAIAREWFDLNQKKFAEATIEKTRWTLEGLLFPSLGSRPIGEITAPEILATLRPLEARGKHETAHRTRQRASQVFRYAIATGRAERDPAADLRGALASVTTRHHPAVTEPTRVGELLRAIDGYQGQPSVGCALRLAPIVFVRPGELRAAEWSEFDLERAEWRIAANRMKMREPHLVPLSRQAIEILRDIHPLTGSGRFVFPSIRTSARPMSENTLTAALRRIGYSGTEMTVHGFRAMASTCLNEQGWAPDVIELQLAHTERNKVRAAYNRAERLPERRKLMQSWADYLDGLRTGGKNVVGIRAGRQEAA